MNKYLYILTYFYLISQTLGAMDIHKLIGKLPRPKRGFVLPSHKYTGPYNPLKEQLDANNNPLPGQEPYNAVDAISLKHDICYRDNKNKHLCDDKMLQDLEELDPKDLRERLDRGFVKTVIATKRKMGWGIDVPETIKWTSELANELHKTIRHKFPTRRVFAKKANDIWAADLIEMIPYSRQNKGYKYLLTVIDIFSKYGWIIPLKRKSGVEVTDAFKKLFKERIPERIWVDNGREFYNQNLKKLLKKENIIRYSTHNELKSCIVERWNRTIKTDMWKYFTANYTYKYIDILPALVEKYNNSYHRSIKCTPKEAMLRENTAKVFKALYGDEKILPNPPKFKVNDRVLISKKRKKFDRGFTPNWKDEVFLISKIKPTIPTTYIIRDERGEELGGSFYEPELQLSKVTEYRIEKVLRKRVKAGQKQEYVKWYGYDSSHNQWINA